MITVDLPDENIIQELNKIGLFKKQGILCSATDFAILNGVKISSIPINDYSFECSCPWWTKEFEKRDNLIRVVKEYGGVSCEEGYKRNIGYRPVIHFSSLEEFPFVQKVKDAVLIEYGEYPRSVASISLSKELEIYYQAGDLVQTDRYYTIDSVDSKNIYEPFQPQTCFEYIYQNEKYIRIMPNHCMGRLSDGKYNPNHHISWVKVEPIIWVVINKNTAISLQALYSNIQFQEKMNHIKNIEQTNGYHYLINYFAKEAFHNLEITKEIETIRTR